MSRFSPLLKRLSKPEPATENIALWPAKDDLGKALYDQLKAEGVKLPATLAKGQSELLFLLELNAPRIWANETINDPA